MSTFIATYTSICHPVGTRKPKLQRTACNNVVSKSIKQYIRDIPSSNSAVSGREEVTMTYKNVVSPQYKCKPRTYIHW
jgi:hypothetical protein